MSFFFPLIFGMSAVLMLVFGTRKTVETHYEAADSRPAYLGGVGASTGTDFERDYAKHRTEPSIVPHVEEHLIKDVPANDIHMGHVRGAEWREGHKHGHHHGHHSKD